MPPGANYDEGDAAILGGPHSRSSPRRRNPMACLICRKRKIKCEFNNGPDICDHCRLKNTKCTVLSVAQEEVLKGLGYTDESITFMSNAELESLQRRLPPQPPSTAEYTEAHLTGARLHQHHVPPSSPHHPLPSTGQDRSENSYHTYDPGNRASPLPYNDSAHNHYTASRTGSTNPAAVPINTPHPQVRAHHQSLVYQNYSVYDTSPSPNHQISYQIPATGGGSVPHHTMADHHQVQLPNIPAHSNAVQSHDHANYSGQTPYPFQAAQQPTQGQITQFQCGVYPASTMTPGYIHDAERPWMR